jgi:hypothetical protein
MTQTDSPERARQELTLQLTKAISLSTISGSASPEVEETYNRALELCRQLGEHVQLFHVLFSIFILRISSNLETARESAEELLALARKAEDVTLLMMAHWTVGGTLFHLGELLAAQKNLEKVQALCSAEQSRNLSSSGAVPYVPPASLASFARSSIVRVLWQLGYPDQALAKSVEAITAAEKISHPQSLAFAMISSSYLHQLLRDAQSTLRWADAAITVGTEHDFIQLVYWASAFSWVGSRQARSRRRRNNPDPTSSGGKKNDWRHVLPSVFWIFGRTVLAGGTTRGGNEFCGPWASSRTKHRCSLLGRRAPSSEGRAALIPSEKE